MKLRVLGSLEAVGGDRPLPLGPRKQRLLLAVLASRPGESTRITDLTAALWGDSPPASAGANLRSYVHRLRAILGAERVVGRGHSGYALLLEPGGLDAEEFLAVARQGEAALAAGNLRRARELLGHGLGLWRGQPFEEFPDVPSLAAAATSLSERRLVALEHRIDADLRLGCSGDLVPELYELVRDHPYRENLHGQLMLALHQSGRQADALAAYTAARDALIRDLGIEPGTELRRLHQAILRGEPTPRLTVRRAVPAAEPSGAVAAGGRPGVHHLPLDIADFTGRRQDIAELTGWLADQRSTGSVVVVMGKAGVGKTSIAVHVGHRLGDRFPDGRVFIDLGGIGGRAASAEEALTRALLLFGYEPADIARDGTERVEQYRTYLARRRILVVLDNAINVAQVRPLLPWGTGSAVIVTSRLPLAGLEPVRRMSLRELEGTESVELLSRMAGADRVAAAPDAAGRIVELCGRLPLAIRIAGAKLATKRHWTLSDLAGRLADEQQRLDELRVGDLAVRSSLLLSYHALDDRSQYVFRVLGQLGGGGFPVWVPATLVGVPIAEMVDSLEQLVDWQLLDIVDRDQAGRQRYRLHDLLALLARELLHEAGSAAERQVAKGEALNAWLSIFDAMETRLVGADRPTSQPRRPSATSYPLGWLPALRSALSAEDGGASTVIETGWSITGTLVAMSFELWSQWDDWRMTREVALHAGRRVDDRLMSASFGDDVDRLVPDVLMVKPGRENPWGATVAGLERALSTFQQLGEVGWHAMVILSLGNVYRAHARLDLAGATLGECVDLFREIGNREWEAAALFSQGSLRVVEGDLAGAVESYRACQAIFIDRRDALWQAYTRRALGYAYEQHGHHVDAVSELERALPVLREHGDQMWEAHTLLTIGRAKLGGGLTDEATGHIDACIDMFRQYGDPRSEAVALRCRAKASPGHLVETYLQDALAAFLRLENPVGVALTLCDLATVYRETERSDEAERYVRLARSLFAEQGLPGLAAAVDR